MKSARRLRNVHLTVAILGLLLCLDRVWAAHGRPDERPVLRVPLTDSGPVVDGRLDEPCWKKAAGTGPLGSTASKAPTEAFVCRDADHLYVALSCTGDDPPVAKVEPGKPAAPVGFVDLMIDSNGDRNSFYLIRITSADVPTVTTSYNEIEPPWYDRTWQPPFESAVRRGSKGWTFEVALPLDIFNKNKTLASKIGFNIRRTAMPGGETHYWSGSVTRPGEWGILAEIPARDSMPRPEYGKRGLNRWYFPATNALSSFLAEEKRRPIRLGPGSAHPGTTGQVKLELEEFLLTGDPHARGLIWDLAVNEQKGELYVLADTRPVRGVAEVRVFDRRGQYLRTIMPFNPSLPQAGVRDLCRKTAREGDTDLIVPKLFETWGEINLYGDHWHLPQKMALAPNGDLIMANVSRGTLWRIRPDGSLPPEGWTSIYDSARNEPFESACWTQDWWHIGDLKNYLPFHSLHYPYFCFDPKGQLYISAGQSSRRTKLYGYHWEVGEQRENYYHWAVSPKDPRGTNVWKCRMHPGVKLEKEGSFGGFSEPSGLVLDGDNLIVADAGNNRLEVLDKDGRRTASITHYEHQGKKHPLHDPTALAIDRDQSLYVLVGSEPRPKDTRVERTLAAIRQDLVAAAAKPPRPPKKLLKLKSWKEPQLIAVSKPLHEDVLQVVVDGGVSPPLVWVANGSGPGNLLQLAGDDLSLTKQWIDGGETLSGPRQSGDQPILNIDPQTGHLYVEDDSNYRLKEYGTVYRLDSDGKVLKKWPPVLFESRNLKMTTPWGTLNYDRHFRYPEEPLFIDSFFGKDGRVYRWKLGPAGVELLRSDRAGKPIPFAATGTNALFVDRPMQANFWHDVYHGMDVDRHGNIYYVAKVDVDPKSPPVSAYLALHRQVNVYDADGKLKKRALLKLDCVRDIQVDKDGNLYVVYRPVERPWPEYLVLSKFSPDGGEPLWSRRWEGYMGVAQLDNPPCHCVTVRHHQTLDERGYLYAAGKYSVQVIDCKTGKLVGEFGSYGNMDCQGPGSRYPHPELPFGTISAMSVWKDRLFVVDLLNRRIAKCRIIYAEEER